MSVDVKICGVTAHSDIAAAAKGGARYIGFNFYKNSPRYLSQEQAAQLAAAAPASLLRVALVVDADDASIDAAIAAVNPHYLQLHGTESPQRVGDIRRRVMPRLIKAIGLAKQSDRLLAKAYARVADMLLFDSATSAKGGSGQGFNWDWLAGYRPPLPWGLAGGLTAENVSIAIGKTGATMVDVSSGIEEDVGKKSPDRIAQFLKVTQTH